MNDQSNLDILREALEINRMNDITGFLIRRGSYFLQVIEGPQTQLDHTMKRISQDRRHFAIDLLHRDTDRKRLFFEWSMGYCAENEENFEIPQLSGHEALIQLKKIANRQASKFMSRESV